MAQGHFEPINYIVARHGMPKFECKQKRGQFALFVISYNNATYKQMCGQSAHLVISYNNTTYKQIPGLSGDLLI